MAKKKAYSMAFTNTTKNLSASLAMHLHYANVNRFAIEKYLEIFFITFVSYTNKSEGLTVKTHNKTQPRNSSSARYLAALEGQTSSRQEETSILFRTYFNLQINDHPHLIRYSPPPWQLTETHSAAH
jgi:hypothetical protein